MNFMQERAATHRNLTPQKGIIEKRHHCPAQQKVLLNLMLR
jgi:hypothetical protein